LFFFILTNTYFIKFIFL